MSRITLAISVYNAENFIERTFMSALRQTYPDIEFLIIDDCGTDNSMSIIERIVSTHPRGGDVKIIRHEQNLGVGATRNTAIDNANGRYIFFMDNDDLIVPKCIELLHYKMCRNPVDFVVGSFACHDQNGLLIRETILADKVISGTSSVAKYRYMYGNDLYVQAWNKLYDLEFIRDNNIRCVPRHYNEDPWLTYQIIVAANSCCIVSDCTYIYTIHPDSITSRNKTGYSDEICRQYVEIQKLKGDHIRNKRNQDLYPSLVYDIIFMSFYHGYRMLSTGNMSDERRKIILRVFKRDFAFPSRFRFNRSYLKLLVASLPYGLPTWVRFQIVRLMVILKVKNIARRVMRLK